MAASGTSRSEMTASVMTGNCISDYFSVKTASVSYPPHHHHPKHSLYPASPGPRGGILVGWEREILVKHWSNTGHILVKYWPPRGGFVVVRKGAGGQSRIFFVFAVLFLRRWGGGMEMPINAHKRKNAY
jgi:hypothetical protein